MIVHRLVERADLSSTAFGEMCPMISGSTTRRYVPSTLGSSTSTRPDGSTGPYARQPAIDPVVTAFAGQTAQQTGEGNRRSAKAGADPVAAAGHAVAMMLGLLAAHRTGQGQDVESSMIVSNMYLNFEDALSYEGKPARPVVDHRQLGISPPIASTNAPLALPPPCPTETPSPAG